MKAAIVTGTSAGMGREFVTQLADHFGGIEEIWVIARRSERLKELALSCPVRLRMFAIDLADSEGLKELQKALEEVKPQVRFLINAAGFGKLGNVGAIPLKQETGMVALNCEALCAMTHLVLPYMPENSRIIQFASSAAFLPQPGFAVYAASKAFVLSYSRALNEELKSRRICVTAVCPGPVNTEFFDVAETSGKSPFYKKLIMADAGKVVALALKDSMIGKSVSVYGLPMKAFRIASKVFPHSLALKIADLLLQRA